MTKPRLMLLGWDAADWKVIQPLLDAGQMPNLARLIAGGVRGNLATIYPPLSPMLWTSIATGKRPYKHGIHGFCEPLPDGSAVRPVTLLSRKTKALWNILNQNGWRSIVVGWWPSHPAEPLNGVMVSNHFQHPVGEPGKLPPLPPGTVHPAELAAALGELRVNPMELSGEFIRLFVPEFAKVDQSKDKRLHSLGKTLAETMSVHAAATELLATQAWDFAAIYYDAIDHFGHGFMNYHPPRLPWVKEDDFALYQYVIANAYRYHDAMLGALLGFADEQTTVVLISDHGFHPDHLRPSYIPAEAAGPAVEHRHFGILCARGPLLKVNDCVYGASLLDICPTLLTVCGLPTGQDMDGKVLANAFKAPPQLEPIASWDTVPGDAGTHSPEAQLDAVASAQAFKQLVELGYVAPPGPNVQETVEETVCELKYNLARAYHDGGRVREAADLLREIWARWPKEHRFGLALIECLAALGEIKLRGQAVADLEQRMEQYRAEAQTELATLEEKKKTEPKEEEKEAPGYGGQTREQFEERKRRELSQPQPLLLEWLKASQALLEGKRKEARDRLQNLLAAQQMGCDLAQRVAGALAQLHAWEPARTVLEQALTLDPENPAAHARLAEIYFRAKQWEPAITAATESLSLLYFQPGLHVLLGRALMENGRFAEAETELQVALAQQPRQIAAHQALGKLCRLHLGRPHDAFVHEGKALSLRNELLAQRRARRAVAETGTPASSRLSVSATTKAVESASATQSRLTAGAPETKEGPAPFAPEVDRSRIITVVSGLPRSGTSMMMQLLAAGGLEPLTDNKRVADEDNPLGYLEFEKAPELATDRSWLPQARGKAVKIVAQLLSFLPPGEHYHVIFMERNLDEVVASQTAMLVRQGRSGAKLDAGQLKETYTAHLQRVRAQLARRADVRLLPVDYAELLANPVPGVERVARFLGGPFNCETARATMHPNLRRQKVE